MPYHRGMTTLVACMAIALGQERAAEIDLVMTGGTVDQLAVELAAQTGDEYEIGKEMMGEVVALSVKGMAVEELRDRVGAVTGGEWVKAGTKWRLVSDTQAVRAQDTKNLQERVKKVREAKAELRKMINTPIPDEMKDLDWGSIDWEKSTPEERKKVQEAMRLKQFQGPEIRIWADMVLRVPDATLATMEAGDRIVYSTKPTAMQTRMAAGNWGNSLTEWIEEHNKKLEGVEVGEIMDDPEIQMIEEMMGSGFLKPTKITAAPSKANLVVSMPGNAMMGMFGRSRTMPTFSLDIYDLNGRRILQTQRGLPSDDGGMNMGMAIAMDVAAAQAEAQGVIPKQETVDESELIKPSKEALEYQKGFSPTMFEPQNMNTEISQEVLRPDLNEPLGFLVGEMLVNAANKKGVQLVACVPDGNYRGLFSGNGRSIAQMKEAIEEGSAYFAIDETYLTVWPKSFSQARATRVDRLGLARIVDQGVNQLAVPLDVISQYALDHPKLESNQLFMAYMSGVVPSMAYQLMMGGMQNFDGLRFYAGLPAADKIRYRQGGTVNLSTLPPVARTQLSRMVYRLTAPIVTVKDMAGRSMMDRMMMGGMMIGAGSMMGGGGTYESEPTEFLPNGLPRNGQMQVSAVAEPYLVQVSEKGKATGMSIPMGAEEIAFFRMITRMEGADSGFSMNDFNRMLRGVRTKYAFSIKLRGEKGIFLEMTDFGKPISDQKFGMAYLPDDIKADVAAQEKKLKDSIFGRMLGGG